MLAVSSEQQSDTLAQQERMANETARAQGWEIVHVVGRGREGVGSGKKGARPILLQVVAELTAAAPAERPKWLWMRRVDRAGRGRTPESMFPLYAIHDLGVGIWDADSGAVDLGSVEGELPVLLKAWLARLENAVRSGKATAGYARRRAEGKVAANLRPYGLVLGTDGHDHVDEDRAAVVREVYRLRLERMGRLTIARQVSAAAPPYLLRDGSTKSVVWDTKAIRRILEQRAYVPVVIDEVTFARVQGVNAELRGVPGERREHADRPLVGVIRCYCGSMLYFQASKALNGEERRPYYVCRATWNHGKHRMMRAMDLEAKFHAFIKRVSAKPSLLNSYRKRSYIGPSPKLLERNIAEARAELAKITKATTAVWDLHTAGRIRDEDLQGRLDVVSGDRDRIVAQLEQLQRDHATAVAAAAPSATSDVEAGLRTAAIHWPSWPSDVKRLFARSLSVHVGGLCLEEDGSLAARAVSPRAARTRRA